MSRFTSLNLPALSLLAAVCLTGCGNDDKEEPQPSAFALSFRAVADGEPVGCDDTVGGFGPGKASSIGLSDLRFYVSNLKLWDTSDQEVALTLDENDFQYTSDAGQVSLVDLTSNTRGSCASSAIAFAEGTRRTNDTLTGTTVVERVSRVTFDVGVPQAVMQDVIASYSAEGAPSPLGELQWTWASGYRHFVMNFTVTDEEGNAGEGYAHLGSRDCGPADGLALEDRDRCEFINTPQVELSSFDLAQNAVTVDVSRMLADLDFVSSVYDFDTFEVIGEGPGVECHSSPTQPDCSTLFEHFGLELESGDARSSKNVVFGAK